MRISLMSNTTIDFNNNLLNNFFSKIDKRITLLAIGILALLSLAFIYKKNRTERESLNQQMNNLNEKTLTDKTLQEIQNDITNPQARTDEYLANLSAKGRTCLTIDEKVYDVTNFLKSHPGGEEILRDFVGKDASQDFADIGHSHEAKEMMKQYYIGEKV
jgi:cytochrome b involved in lipid metabolism